MRQRVLISVPSTSANTTLVFPASIASSIGSIPDQEDVGGVNDMHRAVRQAQPERAHAVETIEQAVDAARIRQASRERGPDRRALLQPAAADGRKPFGTPAIEPAGETLGERGQKRIGIRRVA